MEGTTEHWEPILTGADADRVIALLDSTGTLLTDHLDGGMTPDLWRGAPGPATFFAYFGKALGTSRWWPEVERALRAALDGSFDEEYRLALMHGRTGVLWIAHHLRPSIDTPDLDRLTREHEDVLLERLATRPVPGGYELCKGLVGYARFGLDRVHDAGDWRVAEEVVAALVERAEPADGGVTWWTRANPDRSPNDPGHVRLGLAHGVPGAIAVLAEACRLGVAQPAARRALDDGVRWLLAQKNPVDMPSRFGTSILPVPDGIDRRHARLAWCWGDLGIALGLHAAAVHVGEGWWKEEALDLARHAARRSMKDAGVVEAGFCHGAAGVGHLFNRLYQSTREEIFLTASRRWFEQTLEFSTIRHEITMQTPWGERTLCPWPTKPGLMSGFSGIGLALLAAISDVEPLWDKTLLISVPPGPNTSPVEGRSR